MNVCERLRDLKSGRLTWRCLTAWDLVTYLAAFPSFFFPWKSNKFWRKKVWEKCIDFYRIYKKFFYFIINSAVEIGNLRQACSVSLPLALNFASALSRVSPLFLQWKLAEKQGARKKEGAMEAVMRAMYFSLGF